MTTPIRIFIAWMATIAMLLVGCSSDSGSTTADGGGGGGSTSTHSSGLPITRGEWPFATEERCRDDRAPGCIFIDSTAGAQLSGLAAKDSRFTASSDLTVKYRGGMLVRQPSSDPENPELRVIVTFFDVTFPRSIPGRDGLPPLDLGFDYPKDLTWSSESMGGGSGYQAWPNGEGSRGGLFYQPEPGETLTFAHAQYAMGPTSLLGEHDPIVSLRSSYPGPSADSTSAYFAILNQDPDPDVLDDVRDSIRKVGASDPDATGGFDTFETRLSPWAKDGEPMVSVLAMDAEAPAVSPADDTGKIDNPPRSQPEQYLPSPPPPEDGGTEVGDVDSSEPEDSDTAPLTDNTQVRGASQSDLYDLGFEHGLEDYIQGNVNDPYTNDPTPGSDEDYFFGYLDGWREAEWQELGLP